MKPIVLYSSKGGNTKKIAEEISSELNCQAIRIAEETSSSIKELDNCDLVFVGTGIYWGNPVSDMERFLKTVNLNGTKRFALFLTWGGAGKTDEAVFIKLKGLLETKGQLVIQDVYKCFGGKKFSLSRRGHPNSEDAAAAREWARNIAISKE